MVHWLDPRPGQTFVDGTLGGGGHTEALARRVGPTGLVISLDRDPAALEATVRAAQIAQTAPRGPVYVNLDAPIQEE